MMQLGRRDFALGALALGLLPRPVQAGVWVEVTGSALVQGASDLDAARRRALADALLSAAFAGGAAVQGHSAMSLGRMTSDMLIVRPVGRVLSYQLLGQQQSGGHLHVTIRAQVGQPVAGECHDRRALVLTVYPPEVRVSPSAPAWAEALAHQIAAELVRQTQQRQEVADITLARFLPGQDPSRDSTDWRALTQGSGRVAAGGHGLHVRLEIAPANKRLNLQLRLRLDGPAGERMVQTHDAEIRRAGPSALGRAAPLAQRDQAQLAHDLGRGAVPALQALFRQAGCQPVRALITHAAGRLEVASGRVHGLTRASLAFTIDRDQSVEMLEIKQLSERRAQLAPLDATRPVASFAGRAVRFMDTGTGLG
ncbi:MAG: flagellar assembly protein T N-terminal domain-containing protein [Natronohydrobacter sp.]|nr:flagellar assembly protein T N-terminal domain-containing protein [Natronohydrobacter sp.]